MSRLILRPAHRFIFRCFIYLPDPIDTATVGIIADDVAPNVGAAIETVTATLRTMRASCR